MSEIILQTDVHLPRFIRSLKEEDFWDYLVWEDLKGDLRRFVISPFKNNAFAQTGFDDINIPSEITKKRLPVCKDIKFEITTRSTTKRPSYSKINTEFSNYSQFLLEQYNKGVLGSGYRTIDGEFCVSVDLLKEKLDNDKKNMLEGKEGIEQRLKRIKPVKPKIPEKISIVLGRDYSKLTESNARMHIGAYLLLKEGDKRTVGHKDKGAGGKIKMFKDLLLEDSLQLLGEVPTEGVHRIKYPFDNVVFVHQLEARKTLDHSAVVERFIKSAPDKKIQERSSIGDFVKIYMMMKEGAETLLRKKQQIDDQFMSDYSPKIRDGIIYIRMEGVVNRLSRYRAELTSTKLEQNILMRPPGYF